MEAVADKPVTKRESSILPGQIGVAEAKRREFVVDVPAEHTREDLLEPAYWAHVSREFNSFDRVECRAETGEWFSDLVVVSAGRNYAVMHELRHVDLTAKAAEAVIPVVPSKHAVQWKGPKKFCVVRLSDKAIISEGHHTRSDADGALAQYEQRIS